MSATSFFRRQSGKLGHVSALLAHQTEVVVVRCDVAIGRDRYMEVDMGNFVRRVPLGDHVVLERIRLLGTVRAIELVVYRLGYDDVVADAVGFPGPGAFS